MPRRSPAPSLLLPLLLSAPLLGQDSELPLGLNLPTADHLQGWQPAIRFTHRFAEPARGNSKDFYGLDGGNFAGLGFDLGIAAVPGLNAQVYRTSDGKTVVLALQEQLLDRPHVRLAIRGERFDETIKRATYTFGTVGVTGAALQLPAEFVAGPVTFSLVPTWLSRTTTQDRALFTAGAGLRWRIVEGQSILAEYYPRPARLDSTAYEQGFALGYRFQTKGHRFTLLATNVQGTTAHQVLGGDSAGGPRSPGQWALGFNLVRIF
ncbi:DUF5777 family beta-barrel protein [Geothrix edaphica]|uniref:DUF5777 domain-containing protein n=1 Tax=Geothrix edaphica TaxID=2927976 RepID=A0ABQ5Q031_9BACT|nr:DUF5777 family beta-barrel protein [Geothrix edaphica]GLH67974.1 hypothetical protein GETHED_23380 [Geothrix edaphica]